MLFRSPTAALPRLPLLLAYDCVLSEGRCKKGSHSNRPTLHYCTASGQRSYCSLPLSDLSCLHSFCLLFLCGLQSHRVRTRLLQKKARRDQAANIHVCLAWSRLIGQTLLESSTFSPNLDVHRLRMFIFCEFRYHKLPNQRFDY